jgi:peptide/nickel transport system ATP-binding protein
MTAEAEPLISVRGLGKEFRSGHQLVRAVDGIDFDVIEGETVGLVGESGCGKSTVGRCLLRLLKPERGRIVFGGREIQDLGHAELRPLRRRMQMVFQDPLGSLNPAYTTESTLSDALRPLGLPRAKRRARVLELLDQVGLDARYLRRRPKEMSGGQLQRVGIARALASDPSFLFLDEPTSSLDLSVRGQIVNLLCDLQERNRLTYLFASHDLGIVRFVAHRMIVMYLGRIVETGPAEDVFGSPAHPYTKALLVAAGIRDTIDVDEVRIRGEPVREASLLGGCRYANRCPFVHGRCVEEPPLIRTSKEHDARCWLVAEPLQASAGDRHSLVAANGDRIPEEGKDETQR